MNSLVRRSGPALIAGGLATAVGAAFTAGYPASVPETAASYPYHPAGHVIAQLIWTVCTGLLAYGTLGLHRSGAAGTSRPGRVGLGLGIVGLIGMTACNLGFAFVAELTMDAPAVTGLGIGIWLSSMLAGLGYVLAGVAVLRAGVWHGWRAAAPLLVGGYLFAVVVPVSAVAPALFQWPLAGWGLCFALLGAALLPHRAPVPTTA